MVIASDELTHDKTAVNAFNEALIEDLRSKGVLVNHIHFFIDGAASLFENKFTAQNLVHHQDEFGCSAGWSYFETSH